MFQKPSYVKGIAISKTMCWLQHDRVYVLIFDENLQRVGDTSCPNPPKGFGEQHYTRDSPLQAKSSLIMDKSMMRVNI